MVEDWEVINYILWIPYGNPKSFLRKFSNHFQVKKFFGILPRDTIKEIKTVRMVKRDSKERSVSKSGSNLDDDDDDITGDNSYMGDEPPPPPLPRGNYQNLHDFLTPNGSQNQNFGSLTRTTSGRLQYNDPDEQDDNDDQGGSGHNGYNGVNGKTATLPKTNFKLGEYYKRKYSNKVILLFKKQLKYKHHSIQYK
jgi:hypothetical protein